MRSPPVSGSPGTARRRAADAGRRAASVQLRLLGVPIAGGDGGVLTLGRMCRDLVPC